MAAIPCIDLKRFEPDFLAYWQEQVADAGHDWAKRHASRSVWQARLRAILDGNTSAA